MCLKSGTPTELEASTVVSDRGDTLSPKYAPLMMAPATHPSAKPSARPMPISAMPMVATVVHDEPVMTLTSALMMQPEARKMPGRITSMP